MSQLIGVGTSLIGGLLGSSAAKNAAKTQAAADTDVAGSINKATAGAIQTGYDAITQANAAIGTGVGNATTAVGAGTDAASQYIAGAGGTQAGIYSGMTGGLNPYQAGGTYGLNKLQANAGTFSFDPNNVQNNPAYQLQLAQGEKAIANSAAVRGMGSSGATLKAMDQYSQGLASTSEQALYNQALSTYNTNMQGYQSLAGLGSTANSQEIQAGGIYGGQLTSLAGLGAGTAMQGAGLLTSANMQGASLGANTALQGNEYIGSTGLQGAQMAGQDYINAANATAAGQIGSANAWTGALSGAAGGLMSLSNMLTNAKTPSTYPSTGNWNDAGDLD